MDEIMEQNDRRRLDVAGREENVPLLETTQ